MNFSMMLSRVIVWTMIPFCPLALAIESRPASASETSQPTCPDTANGETAEDCPWAQVARQLTAEATQNKPLLPLLEKSLPQLVRQLEKDHRNETAKNLWGRSINFDEYAKGIIVNPAILSSLGALFGADADGRVVHAGLEHTYGYLFSTLKTSFGFKRARWVRRTLEEGFDVPDQLLSPHTSHGTFFSNLTYFLGRNAFHSDLEELKQLQRLSGIRAIKALVHYPFSKLKVTRLEEKVKATDTQGKERTVTLRTDLLLFPSAPQEQKNTHLLIYSIVDPSQGGARLITAFPVETSFVDKALNPANLGTDKPVTTRYNAFVEGISDQPGLELKGSRQVIKK